MVMRMSWLWGRPAKTFEQSPSELRSLVNSNTACPSCFSIVTWNLRDLGDLGSILGPSLR